MREEQIGTLIRCADINERRIEFYREIGIQTLQLAGVYEPWLAPGPEAEKRTGAMFELFRRHGIRAESVFLSFPDQDWSRPREGIGLVPPKTRAGRMVLACRQMDWAQKHGIKYISCHVGLVPEKNDCGYRELIEDLKQLAMFAAANSQDFLFETGPEKVSLLKETLDDIALANTGINFDPANLLIYGNDDPSVLLDELGGRVRVVHCKDADRPTGGAARGKETVLGKGSTRFASLLKRLVDSGFNGPLIIERELPFGPEQEKDVKEAVQYIKSIMKEHESC